MASPSTLHRSLELAGTLPALMVAADRVAATVIQGVHGRRRVGQGDAFWQYRPYRDGDSASQIDWRQSARSRHLFVRETEWEAAASVWLRSEEHTSELQSHSDLVCRLLLEKKKKNLCTHNSPDSQTQNHQQLQ